MLLAVAGAPAEDSVVWLIHRERPSTVLTVGLDPLLNPARSGRELMGCGLLRLDGRGRPKPDLARRLAASEGGRVWDARLRPGLRLADGSPLTARVFVQLWMTQLAGRPDLDGFLSPLDGPPRAVDDRTVRFRLHQPAAGFAYQLAHPWLTVVDPAASPGDGSSLGPYRLSAPASGHGAGTVHLQARHDHDHGLPPPVDLVFTDRAVGEHWCQEGTRRMFLVRGTGGAAEPEVVPLLMVSGDEQSWRQADALQASALDTGLRLRRTPLPPGTFERHLRSGEFSYALLSLPARPPATARQLQGRLAAFGAWDAAMGSRLARSRQQQPRQQAAEAATVWETLVRERRVVPLEFHRECYRLEGSGSMKPVLSWLSRSPAARFSPTEKDR